MFVACAVKRRGDVDFGACVLGAYVYVYGEYRRGYVYVNVYVNVYVYV